MRNRLWRGLVTFPAMALVAGTGTVVASSIPAAAVTATCGMTVTTSITLTNDVGPCPADGLVVTGSNIVVDLGGHRVFANSDPGDSAGVRLTNTTGVTVQNGTVEGFAAGVSIQGGSANTVRAITARNNINHGTADTCDLGDGITVLNSSKNQIAGNTLDNNGPYSGISLVENSDGNVIRGNTVLNSNVVAADGCGINNNQDEGIRIEGPGANNNTVDGNTVQHSLLDGIGLHGNVGCQNNPNPASPPNTDNIIRGNNVSLSSGNAAADGISVLAQGPFGTVVCAAYRNTFLGNTSTGNQGNGIYIPGTSTNNTVNGNTVNGNGVDGIRLEGPVFRNVFTNVGPTLFQEVSPTAATFSQGTDYAVLSGSGSGNVTARVVPVGPITIAPAGTVPFDTAASGCSPSDFAGFPAGAIALVQRGFCARATKAQNAQAAGASAVIMFNEGSAGRTGLLTAGVNPITIPVVGTTYALGVQLYNQAQAGPVTVHIITNTTNVNTQIAPGAENTTLLGNRGQGNAEHDGHDNNVNCDHNRWSGNQFGTVNQACVAAGGTGTVKP